MIDELAAYWTWEAFVASFLWGLAFPFAVTALLGPLLQRQFDGADTHRQILASWQAGLIMALFIIGLSMFQTVAALVAGDVLWERILSRMFPALFVALGVAVGTWLSNRWRRRHGH